MANDTVGQDAPSPSTATIQGSDAGGEEPEPVHVVSETTGLLNHEVARTAGNSTLPGKDLAKSIGLPRYLWLPVAIFMLGSAADYCEGSFFATGYTDIGSKFQAQENAVWLEIGYTTVLAIGRPVYSISCDRWSWGTPILMSYFLFTIGLLLSSLCRNLVALIFAQLLTAAGSAGMVYVPNLVFNVPEVVSLRDRPRWITVGQVFAAIGQWVGSQLADSNLRKDTVLMHKLLGQSIFVFGLMIILAVWISLSRDQRPDMRVRSLNPARQQDHGHGFINVGWCTVAGIILLALPIIAFCSALGWAVEDSAYHVLWSPLILVGISSSSVFWLHQKLVCPQAALIPVHLPTPQRSDILRIFAAGFFKEGASSAFLFVVPWISQNSTVSKTYLLRSFWFSIPIGGFATAYFTARLNKIKVSLVAGAVLSILSATTFSILVGLITFELDFPWAMYLSTMIFGIGNGMAGAALLTRLLAVLKGHKRYRAIIYAGFHLTFELAESIFSALSNTMMLWSAAKYIRESLSGLIEDDMLRKIIQACRQDNQCTINLPEDIKNAVHTAYLKASVNVCLITIASGVGSVLIMWYWIPDVVFEGGEGETQE